MRVAYLTTQYPKVSHTFIRRELRELERRGHVVLRLAIRAPESAPVDPEDRAEQDRTTLVLGQPPTRLLRAALASLGRRPAAALGALGLALAMGWRSSSGTLRHLAYWIEATFVAERLRTERIDHVHVHFGTNAAAVARLARRLGGPPYSMTVHGPDEFDAPRGLDLAGKVRDAAFVVAVSSFGRSQLLRWTERACWPRIHVVHCAVAPRFLEATPAPSEALDLVCVGRLTPQKGQLLLVEAFATLVKEGFTGRLVLAGDGELRADVEQRVRELAIEGRVEITGWLDEAQVAERLRAARCAVQPSFAEGLPVVLMEALALGRPVVSTYVAGIPELVRPGENGWLVPAGDVDALAEALRQVAGASEERLAAMGTAGRARVAERHRLETEVDRLERLIEQSRA